VCMKPPEQTKEGAVQSSNNSLPISGRMLAAWNVDLLCVPFMHESSRAQAMKSYSGHA